MSEQIFLSRIQLTQFRSFARLDIPIEPEPGVLVVHGSNGLGKSSLFTGFEWALTDQIDHFREAQGVKKVGNYLARWRSETGPTSVAMSFSDGASIERVLPSKNAKASVLAGSVEDITGYLRAPDWTQKISALGQYLLLTNFLGQSALSRFMHRDSGERFNILKEAAQSSEIEAIGSSLHGTGNTVAVRAYARRIEMFDREAAEIGELLERETSLRDGASGSGALDDARAQELAREIVGLLSSVRAQTANTNLDNNSLSLEALALAAKEAREELRKQETAIERARSLVEDVQRHRITLTELEAGIAQTDAQLKQAGEDLERALQDQAEASHNRSQIADRTQQQRGRRDRLFELRDAQAALDALQAKMATGSANYSKETARLTAAVVSYERTRRRDQIIARLNDETRLLGEQLIEDRTRVDLIERWEERRRAIIAMEQSLQESEAANPQIDIQVAQAESDLNATGTSLEAQKRALKQLQSAYGSLSNGVTAIAAHLLAGTCDCPVCDTHFDDAGDLGARAAGAAERLAPALFEQEDALASLDRQYTALLERVAALRSAQSQIRFQRTEIVAARSQNAEILDRIAIPPSISNVRGLLPHFQSICADRERRRQRKHRWFALLVDAQTVGPLAAVQRERDQARLAVDSASANLTNIRSNIEKADADVRAARASLRLSDPELGDLPGTIEAAETTLAEEVVMENVARERLEVLIARVGNLNTAISSATARRTELIRQQAQANAYLAEGQMSWRAIFTASSDPDEALLQTMVAEHADRLGSVGQADDALQRLRTGRAAWAAQVTHRAVLDELRLAVDAPPNASREELRAAAEVLRKSKADAAARTRMTKDIAQSASLAISAELEGFNAEYVKPLGFLMKQINQAILCDPRVGLDLRVNKKKIEQNAVKVGEVPSNLKDIDPILVHSEGQMAALSVSMLCAASLTFPWSRWRSLVLDDPLQHNDAIHAAAFADLMSSLVVEKGYQILVSTHDLAQAEFLRRKFDARKIPCSTLSLLGTGRDGVEWDYQPARRPQRLSAIG